MQWEETASETRTRVYFHSHGPFINPWLGITATDMTKLNTALEQQCATTLE